METFLISNVSIENIYLWNVNSLKSVLFISFCLLIPFAKAKETMIVSNFKNTEIIVLNDQQTQFAIRELNNSPNKRTFRFLKRLKKNPKLVAAVLAFPLPFGFTGLHRIYLGTKPYVPLVYMGTLGGCFGVLPFVDFIKILSTKDIEQLRNEPKVIMWER